MAKFGYSIENALVTKIVPADAVVNVMNDINAARREKVVTEARPEASKITMVKQAEAEAEAKALSGQGVARERKAIVDGLRDSVLDFEKGVSGVDAHDVMSLLMMTQYFDALRRHWSGQQHHPDAPFTFGRAGSLQPATQLDNNRSTCCRKIAGTGAGQ